MMSPEKRSALMSRIRGRDTGPERVLTEGIRSFDCLWESHARDLPGCPDFVFRDSRLAVFVDGDFWHGWRFSVWRHKLPTKWEIKIAQNRLRDRRNRAKLRRQGWTVLRIWEHQIERDMAACVLRIKGLLDGSGYSALLPKHVGPARASIRQARQPSIESIGAARHAEQTLK
jgi:DNA mismatch endonuclease (patch repair protein)